MRRILLLAAALLSTLVVGPACTPASAPPETRGVVWVVIDAAAARYFGVYGNELPTSPKIDAFAREATVFERAYCQVPWTLGSAGSYLTGRFPRKQVGRVAPGQLLPHFLGAAGVRTAGFSENPYVTGEFGFDDGFETFREYFPYQKLLDAPESFGRLQSDRTVDDVISWLDGLEHVSGERFFLYVHLLPPHAPYDAPEPFAERFDPHYEGEIDGSVGTLIGIRNEEVSADERDVEHLRALYQENISYADAQVGRLLAAIERLGLDDDTLVIVASDHGEGFMEHGHLLHNRTLYEEMMHVPLLVRSPGGREAAGLPARWPGPVELRQLYATVCRAMGVECRITREGLFETIERNTPEQDVAFAVSSLGGRQIVGAIEQRFKFAAVVGTGRNIQLYDLESDPGETRNLVEVETETAERLKQRLADEPPLMVELEAHEVAPDTRKQLESLGYLE